MAISTFNITVNLSGSVAQVVNSTTFQAVAPWGKSSVRTTMREAIEDVMNRCGNEQTGRMGLYFANSASTNATEVGIP